MYVRAQRAQERLGCGHHGYWWHHWFAVPSKDSVQPKPEWGWPKLNPGDCWCSPSRCHGNTGCSLKLPACITWCSRCKQSWLLWCHSSCKGRNDVCYGESGGSCCGWTCFPIDFTVSLVLRDKTKTHKSFVILQQFCGWGTCLKSNLM